MAGSTVSRAPPTLRHRKTGGAGVRGGGSACGPWRSFLPPAVGLACCCMQAASSTWCRHTSPTPQHKDVAGETWAPTPSWRANLRAVAHRAPRHRHRHPRGCSPSSSAPDRARERCTSEANTPDPPATPLPGQQQPPPATPLLPTAPPAHRSLGSRPSHAQPRSGSSPHCTPRCPQPPGAALTRVVSLQHVAQQVGQRLLRSRRVGAEGWAGGGAQVRGRACGPAGWTPHLLRWRREGAVQRVGGYGRG